MVITGIHPIGQWLSRVACSIRAEWPNIIISQVIKRGAPEVGRWSTIHLDFKPIQSSPPQIEHWMQAIFKPRSKLRFRAKGADAKYISLKYHEEDY